MPRASRADRVVEFWIADRAGDCVVGLGPRLTRIHTTAISGPRRVAACLNGRVWVVATSVPRRDEHDGRNERNRVALLSPEGELLHAYERAHVLDLDVAANGDALVLEREAGATYLERVTPTASGGQIATPCSIPGRVRIEHATWIRVDGPHALVGGGRTLSLYDWKSGFVLLAQRREYASDACRADDKAAGAPSVVARGRWERGARSIARMDAGGGGWWTLGARVVRRSARLVPIRSWSLPARAGYLASDNAGSLWVSDASRTVLFRRVALAAASGAQESMRAFDYALTTAPQALAIDRHGGPVFALAGAVVRASRAGAVLDTQGGFSGLVDLCVVPRAEALVGDGQ